MPFSLGGGGSMLKKLTDLEIPIDKPFDNDRLSREKVAINLTNLLKTVSEPFVLSVNSPWGGGKSTFVKMWKQHLENENHPCIYFNSWENDYCDNPLIAFISEISEFIDKENEMRKEQESESRLKTIGAELIKDAVPLAVKYATAGIVDKDLLYKYIELVKEGSKEDGYISEYVKEQVKNYIDNKKTITKFQENLNKLKNELRDIGKKSPMIIFVDELDRCRPDYALKMLEGIKHLFCIREIVFVLSIDRNQLSEIVKSSYGSGMDAHGYLRRFIDLEYDLPLPENINFCDYLFNEYNLDEIFNSRNEVFGYDKEHFIRTLSKFSDVFEFHLRTIAQCFMKINIAIRTTQPNNNLFMEHLIFLVFLKAKDSNLYYKFKNKDVEIEAIISSVQNNWEGKEFFKSPTGQYVITIILEHFYDFPLAEGPLVQIRPLVRYSEDDLKNVKDLAKYFQEQGYRHIHDLVFNRIEFTEAFLI